MELNHVTEDISTAAGAKPTIGGKVVATLTEANVYTQIQNFSASGVVLPNTTWTPTIQDATLSDALGQTYSLQVGTAVVVDGWVFADGRITVTSLGTLSGAVVYIANLPYVSSSTSARGSSITFSSASGLNLPAAYALTGTVGSSGTTAAIRVWDTTGGTTNLTQAEASSTMSIDFIITYRKA